MKALLPILAVALVLGGVKASGSDEYETALLQLKEGSTDSDVRHSLGFLRAAKEKAFPSLLRHLNDGDLASTRHFPRDEVVQDPRTGSWSPYHPSIGEIAFAIIHESIEGNWPKGYRSLYVITLENVRQWLENHAGLSLREMQIAAAKEALAKAEAENGATADDHSSSGLDFIQKHTKRVLEGADPNDWP